MLMSNLQASIDHADPSTMVSFNFSLFVTQLVAQLIISQVLAVMAFIYELSMLVEPFFSHIGHLDVFCVGRRWGS